MLSSFQIPYVCLYIYLPKELTKEIREVFSCLSKCFFDIHIIQKAKKCKRKEFHDAEFLFSVIVFLFCGCFTNYDISQCVLKTEASDNNQINCSYN